MKPGNGVIRCCKFNHQEKEKGRPTVCRTATGLKIAAAWKLTTRSGAMMLAAKRLLKCRFANVPVQEQGIRCTLDTSGRDDHGLGERFYLFCTVAVWAVELM
jgi:hypothetical protein